MWYILGTGKIEKMSFINKIFKKIILYSSLGILLFLPGHILADGVIIGPSISHTDQFNYLSPKSQQAFINHENGIQKMIIAIAPEIRLENAVWIFPVPADPNKVTIDVLSKLPNLYGNEITDEANLSLLSVKNFLYATQIYPRLFWELLAPRKITPGGVWSLDVREPFYEAPKDITIYERLEKEGVISEIITAKNGEAIYQYLKEKNPNFKKDSIPILDNYIGKNFSFVVSWISENSLNQQSNQSNSRRIPPVIPFFNQEENYQMQLSYRSRGIFVTFPSKKIYYPLILTSVYGSEIIPISIRIFGFNTPNLFRDIKNYTKTDYFIQSNPSIADEELKNFYGPSLGWGKLKNIKYTKIEINAPSKLLTEDLWIQKRSPLKALYASFIIRYSIAIGVLCFILASILAGIFSGLLIFKEARNKKGLVKLSLLGLSNCLSIIGLLITTALIKINCTKTDDTLIKNLKEQARPRRPLIIDLRKVAFVPLFSLVFLAVVWILVNLITISL